MHTKCNNSTILRQTRKKKQRREMLIPIFANEYTTVLNTSSKSNSSGSSNVIDIYSNFQMNWDTLYASYRTRQMIPKFSIYLNTFQFMWDPCRITFIFSISMGTFFNFSDKIQRYIIIDLNSGQIKSNSMKISLRWFHSNWNASI